MDVRLSIVMPTLGRDTLERALRSCAGADEIVLVADHARGEVKLPELPESVSLVEGSWGITGGHGGRQEGIRRATGTHLAFFDDDDEYTPGAIEVMRDAACERPVIFRMDHYAHGVLWRDPELRFGNVSTQMYVVPNKLGLGSWTPHMPGLPEPGGDYTFIRETCENMGPPVWRKEITSVIRPELHSPSISIVTPWHNHRELTADYFLAVGQRLSGDELLIVDNGSDPPLPFDALRVEHNLGFVGGCNRGLLNATKDAVLFLNNDIRMLHPHWLKEIRENLEPGVIVGPLRFDNHARVDDTSLPYVDGWCLAGMREDLLEIGGFDPDLVEPAYYSDNLLCLEARAHGMSLRDLRPGLQHLENVTAGNQFSPSVKAAATANRARYEARARELLAAV